MALLSVTDLACTRGGVPVLEGVSFALSPGEALVLRGPNGSGKTTLLRTLAGLQPPRAGRVEADPDTVAYGAHADGLKPTLTAAETLAFWAAVYGSPVAPGRALAAYGIADLADRRAGDLSAGQKRRLSLARLVVAGRPLWMLDEPTVSLDAAAVGLFARAVSAHLAGGGAALIATHIDLGLPETRVLDLGPYRTRRTAVPAFGDGW